MHNRNFGDVCSQLENSKINQTLVLHQAMLCRTNLYINCTYDKFQVICGFVIYDVAKCFPTCRLQKESYILDEWRTAVVHG